MPLPQGSAAIPAQAGIGLRAVHHQVLLEQRPAVAWLEAHSENYFADGGAQIDSLRALRRDYPLSLHGVGLSLGSTDPLDEEHLRRLSRLVQWSEPAFVSEHLSWSSAGGVFLNDLLPLPYTEEALRHMIARVHQLQERLQRPVLIENISSYLRLAVDAIPEPEFLAALAAATGCGLLLDVNNVYVSARNHGFDARAYIRAIPARHVQELHLAGHSVNRHDGIDILIDTHSTPVCAEVWRLYEDTIAHVGPKPTLIEWDTDIPDVSVLLEEAARADRILEGHRALAA